MKRTLKNIEKRIVAVPSKPVRILLYSIYVPVLIVAAAAYHINNFIESHEDHSGIAV